MSEKLGQSGDWYQIILGAASRFRKGQDIHDLASMIATHIVQSLSDPNDKLAQLAAKIRAKGEWLGPLINRASQVRARSLAQEKTIVRRSVSASDEFDTPDVRTATGEEESRISELRDLVIKELAKERDLAQRPETKARYDLAMKVAAARMENPPNVVGLKELMARFGVKKVRMFETIRLIQQAMMAVAKSQGIATPDTTLYGRSLE